jgi:hypothetical protein
VLEIPVAQARQPGSGSLFTDPQEKLLRVMFKETVLKLKTKFEGARKTKFEKR